MSANGTTIQDEDGDYSDWIEIYNPLPDAFNLKGFYLSDDTQNPAKWQFPEVHVPSDGFLIVFASDKNRPDTLHLHTNFKIKDDGETLVLSDSLMNVYDLQQPVALGVDISFGRFPDGSGEFITMVNPSPGMPNIYGSVLTFSHSSGVYDSGFYLKVLSSSKNDTIRYTLDGNLPDSLSPFFPDSILIDFSNPDTNYYSMIPTTPDSMGDYLRLWKTPLQLIQKAKIVRVQNFKEGQPNSKVYTMTFFPDSLFKKVHQFPVVSLISDTSNLYNHYKGIYVPGNYFSEADPDWTGNYFLKTSTWERPVHVSYFDKSGSLKIEQDAGMRIHGKITRHAPQKSLRLYARSEYGDSWFDYPLISQLPQDKYKRFLLQTTYGDGWQTMFKDQMITDLVSDLHGDLIRSEPVHVFLNGEYWGFHHLREYFDQYYLQLKYDVDPDSVDILENELEPEVGDSVNYQQLLDYLESHDIREYLVYDTIKSWIDVNNFIDYQITEIYFNNTDWPGSNVKYWREKKDGAKWRWLLFDLDASCFNPEFNTLEFATANVDTSWQNPPWSTYLLRTLLLNDNFKDQFIIRFAELLNTTFKTQNVLDHIYRYKAKIDSIYELHSQRWNYPISQHDWEWAIENSMVNFAKKRPCIITEYIKEYFELTEFGFSCDTIGIGEPALSPFSVEVFPNPAREMINVKIKNAPGDVGTMSVQNPYGQTIHEIRINIREIPLTSFNVNHFQPGVYFIRFTFNRESITKKIIIQ